MNETASTALACAVTDLDVSDAATLRQAFEAMFAQADEWVARAKEIRVTGEDQKREMRLARESRLALKEIRVNAEKTRKRLKEDSLRRGKAIDGLANVIKGVIEPIEGYLLEQESFAERAASARRDALRAARADALRALGADPTTMVDLGEMTDEQWWAVRDGAELAKRALDEEVARQEAVRREAERIEAERREQERLAAIKAETERVDRERRVAEENARLRAEAEERRAKAAAEREEREKAEAEARRAREEKEAAEAALAAEKERVARVERERIATEERRADEEARAKAAAEAAPDREKLLAFAATLRATPVPTLATARGKKIAAGAAARLLKLVEQVEEAARAMTPSAAQ